jgi:uncharacterized membrane protein
MSLMLLGLVIFFAIHLVPTRVDLRASLVQKFGLLPYKALFSLVALAGFVLIVIGKGQAEFIAVWTPPAFMRHITMLLVLFAFILLVATYVPSNIKAKVRNPMLTATKLWATGHLLANGDLASIVLFGSFLAYAIVDVISVKKRGVAVESKRHSYALDGLVVVIGVVAYGLVAMNHLALFGVPAIVSAATMP